MLIAASVNEVTCDVAPRVNRVEETVAMMIPLRAPGPLREKVLGEALMADMSPIHPLRPILLQD